RQIYRRDRGLCRFPGCGRRIRQIHHVRWWHRDDGPTDTWNLAGVCWAHHHHIHEGGWALDGNADDELTFTSPWGRTLLSRPPPLLPETKQRIHDITGLDLG
ncbi:MAG: HNH endonuclease, partial [Microthrixaceae bacterium]